MTLRTKKSAHPKRESGQAIARNSQKIPMPHNSVFVLGWRTNGRWLHGIRPDKRMKNERSPEELAYEGERISLTFRNIGTFTNVERTKIWGQGARSKNQTTAGDVSTTNNTEMEAMILAFGKENQQADFNWDAEYGTGFDVMNLVSNTATLFLCSDEIANLRVKMAIRGRKFPCTFTRSKPASSLSIQRSGRTIFALSGNEVPVFRDMDAANSETLGDIAILFYLGKLYPFFSSTETSSSEIHRIASNVFPRITQANELLFLWQELRGSPLTASTRATHQIRRMSTSTERASQPGETNNPLATSNPIEAFESELELWEEYAEETEYIAGEMFAIVDCAFWPVLNEVVRRWEGWSERRYPCLADYWMKVGAMESTRKALAEKGDAG